MRKLKLTHYKMKMIMLLMMLALVYGANLLIIHTKNYKDHTRMLDAALECQSKYNGTAAITAEILMSCTIPYCDEAKDWTRAQQLGRVQCLTH